jgi:hypothetical protein
MFIIQWTFHEHFQITPFFLAISHAFFIQANSPQKQHKILIDFYFLVFYVLNLITYAHKTWWILRFYIQNVH